MVTAEEFHVVTDNILVWSAFDPAVKCELCTTAYKRAGGLVVVDPILLTDAAWKELRTHGELRAVLVTNENHARAAATYRSRFRIPVCAPSFAAKKLEVKPDVYILGKDLLYGLKPIAIPGATPGETAYLSEEGCLIIGDALTHLGTDGLQLLPDKYCSDPAENRRSLATLPDLPISLFTFAHGQPLRDPQPKLKALLG